MDYATNMIAGARTGLESAQASQVADAGKTRFASFEELKGAAKQFEAFFLNYLLKTMRKTVNKSEMFSGGRGEDVFEGIFDREVATKAVDGQDFGVAQTMIRQLTDELPPVERIKAVNYTSGMAAAKRVAETYKNNGLEIRRMFDLKEKDNEPISLKGELVNIDRKLDQEQEKEVTWLSLK